jgi:hypothetical protein
MVLAIVFVLLKLAQTKTTNIYMKNKLLSLASLLAVFNANAIEIGPTGSGVEMSGFVVFDYVNDDGSGPTAGVNDGDSAFMTSEVEVDFDFSSGPVSFALDIDVYKDGESNGSSYLEEAVATYAFNDNLSVSAGKMLSYLGFEAYDAPNMYQISSAYVTSYGYLYDGYADGISVDYATDMFSVGIWAGLEEQSSFEYALAYTGIENLTAKYIYADYGGSSESKQTIWASYSFGSLLLAGELANHEDNGGTVGDDTDAYLIMGNYGFTDSLSLTLRFSSTEDKGTTTSDIDKLTVSPTYMVTDSLALLAEYSDIEDQDEFFGVEIIYTF